MLSVKQELLSALAQALEHLSPGSGDKAVFESVSYTHLTLPTNREV